MKNKKQYKQIKKLYQKGYIVFSNGYRSITPQHIFHSIINKDLNLSLFDFKIHKKKLEK